MMKGRSKSENISRQLLSPPVNESNNKMLLTFVKMSELPHLTPPATTKLQGKSNLKDILEHRSKYIDGYFQSIRETR
jgi:hypothetical protein